MTPPGVRLVVTDRETAENWDATVASLNGSLFQSHAWAEYASQARGGHPVFLRWLIGGRPEPVAAAVGIRRPGPDSTLGRWASRLHFDGPPASRSADLDLLTPLQSWVCETRSIIDVHLGSFDPRGSWNANGLPCPSRRFEFVVFANRGEDVLRGMRKGARSAVRRAARLGVEASEVRGEVALKTFSRLHEETLGDLRRRKGVNSASFDREKFARNLRVLTESERARVYLATAEGRPVAGSFFGTFNGSAYQLMSGASPEARGLQAMPRLLEVAITGFLDDGISHVNLGGAREGSDRKGSPDHGLFSFKQGLGGEPVPCVGGSWTARPARAWCVQRLILLRSKVRR